MYYTIDWQKSRDSVELLADMDPELVITGHGLAMQEAEMRVALHEVARGFGRVAVPSEGEYVENPATAEAGTAYRNP